LEIWDKEISLARSGTNIIISIGIPCENEVFALENGVLEKLLILACSPFSNNQVRPREHVLKDAQGETPGVYGIHK
jgi:hypothetical protein